MVITHIWRNCLFSELNISDTWFNSDALLASPKRQDIFLVKALRHEINSQILPQIKDAGHKTKIFEWLKQENLGEEFTFVISRLGNFIQLCPFLSTEYGGSLWEKHHKTHVIGVHDLKSVGSESMSEHD